MHTTSHQQNTSSAAMGSLNVEIIKPTNDIERNSMLIEADVETPTEVVSDEVETTIRNRKNVTDKSSPQVVLQYQIEKGKNNDGEKKEQDYKSWKRILLLIIAITVHNIPGIIICFSSRQNS